MEHVLNFVGGSGLSELSELRAMVGLLARWRRCELVLSKWQYVNRVGWTWGDVLRGSVVGCPSRFVYTPGLLPFLKILRSILMFTVTPVDTGLSGVRQYSLRLLKEFEIVSDWQLLRTCR